MFLILFYGLLIRCEFKFYHVLGYLFFVMFDKSREILFEYLRVVLGLGTPPVRRSNKGFKGYIFTDILSRHLKDTISDRYSLVVGPLWIKGLEWIEWDLAITEENAMLDYARWYNPDKIVVLFECKVSGIYGKREELCKLCEKLKDRFKSAHKVCKNLMECYYVSLVEAKPIDGEDGINYYKVAKEEIKDSFISSFMFFNSRSVEKLCRQYLRVYRDEMDISEIAKKVACEAEKLDEWVDFVEALRGSLRI